MEHPLFPGAAPVARAAIRGDAAHPELMGEALLYPYGKGTLFLLRAVGLPHGGFFALHIHEGNNCSSGGDVAFSGAGGHYDPHDVPHPWHAGDLPPLLSAANGAALLAVYSDRFQPQEVIGRTVILHEKPDDFRTQPSGDSGARLACGVIEAV